MVRYETLILARTEITDDEISTIERQFDKLLSEYKGETISFDRWGKYHLAYPVGKHDYGIYMLYRYELPQEKLNTFMKDLDTFFKIKCNEFVLRFATVRLPKNAPTNYAKPESLDSNRSTNVEAFMKENKMEGLLGNVDFDQSEQKNEEN
jgi:small subunit ribosomal protein S6